MESTLSAATSSPEASALAAPGVVVAIVVDRPTSTLEGVLAALVTQDYPNVQVLVLLTGSDADEFGVVHQIVQTTFATTHLPQPHIYQLGANPGFGPAANTALRLVEGDSGFFLVMHDDVILAPDSLRILVEELYRSNAGMVGPKFVEWEETRRLQAVGFDCDWFGELDSDVEPHELDQEQHDAVRDVFVLPSACFLIRADLFRELGGFEPTIEFFGEDLDLCWRAHMSGARVVVVPAATVRHQGTIVERLATRSRDSASFDRQSERHRMATVASLTGARRLPIVLPLLILLSFVEVIGAIVRGRWQRAIAVLGGLFGLVPSIGTIARRRSRVRLLRRVPDHEVVEMQVRGSVRWKRMIRHRRYVPSVHLRTPGNAARERLAWVMAVWGALAVFLFLGGRQLWNNGVHPVGDLLPLPESPRDLLHQYLSGWWAQDLGSTTAQPTSTGLIALGGVVTLGHMGLLQTLITIGLIPMGWLGVSKLCAVVANERARIVGVIAYAAVPLPYAAVASGRHQVLIAYAVVPWALHLIRSFGGIGRSIVDDEPGDVVDHPSTKQRIRIAAKLSLLFGVTLAFSPSVVLVVLLSSLLWLLTAAISGGSTRAAGLGFAGAISATAAAVVLNMPWITRYLSHDGWSAIVGAPTHHPEELGLWDVLRFGIGPAALGGLIVLLYVPLLVAPLVSKNSRFIWASRAAILSIASIALALLNSGDHLPFRLPETGILLAPVASCMAIGAAIIVMAFGIDVRGGRFGWRQPLALLSLVTLPLGLLPVAAASSNGQWEQPSITLAQQMKELLGDTSQGDYRVLVIGDPRLVTSGQHPYGDGLAYAIVQNGVMTMLNQVSSTADDSNKLIRPLLDAVATGSTNRVGRLMAPLGIRYIVIPLLDRVRSTSDSPLPLPLGLREAFAEQLDLHNVYGPSSMVIFENSQWIPLTGMLSTVAAEQSSAGGAEALVATELSGSLAALNGTTSWLSPTQELPAGRFHMGVPFDSRWRLTINGQTMKPQASFGTVMHYETGVGGAAQLNYSNPMSRYLWVLIQMLLWLAVVVGILQPNWRRRLARQKFEIPVMPPVVTLSGTNSETVES